MKPFFLPGLIVIFAAISLIMLQSIAPSLVLQQFMFYLIGFLSFVVVSLLPFDFLKRSSMWGYLFFTFLLLITFLIGHTSKGSTRWLTFGFGQIQPSQLLKPFFALYLAQFVSDEGLRTLKSLIKFSCIVAVPFLLVFLQPDLGTSMVLAVISLSIFLCSGIKKRFIAPTLLLVLTVGLIGWSIVLKDYQKQRIASFLSPSSDVQGASYHAQQSVIAVGSGKILGRGLGHGVQSHLRFLPEKQTDFMFASLSEEFGYVGSITVLILYSMLFFILLKGLERQKNTARFLTILGIFSLIATQTIVNIGMNIGVLPITGITLPLLSYGGSSILGISISLGIVASASKNRSAVSAIEIR